MSNDLVKNPAHYMHPSGIQVIDIIRWETFLRGNIIKYVMRAPYKGEELQDLHKAKEYLEWEIERIERGYELSRLELESLPADTDEINTIGGLEEEG
jgi:hypothetical protein